MRSPVRSLAVLSALSALAGCGVTTGGTPEELAAAEVPYGLLSSAPTAPATSSVAPVGDEPRVYFVSADDVLVPRGRDVAGAGRRARLVDLLAGLSAGPTADELDDELTTALPPGAELAVVAVEDETVTVDLTGPGQAPAGLEGRLAVAQIVLTATSLPGVRAVLITSEGHPLEAPLPSGELTTEPLEAGDFDPLLVTPPS